MTKSFHNPDDVAPILNDESPMPMSTLNEKFDDLWSQREGDEWYVTELESQAEYWFLAGAKAEREAVLEIINAHTGLDHCPVEPTNDDLDSGYALGCSDTVCSLERRIKARES